MDFGVPWCSGTDGMGRWLRGGAVVPAMAHAHEPQLHQVVSNGEMARVRVNQPIVYRVFALLETFTIFLKSTYIDFFKKMTGTAAGTPSLQ